MRYSLEPGSFKRNTQQKFALALRGYDKSERWQDFSRNISLTGEFMDLTYLCVSQDVAYERYVVAAVAQTFRNVDVTLRRLADAITLYLPGEGNLSEEVVELYSAFRKFQS